MVSLMQHLEMHQNSAADNTFKLALQHPPVIFTRTKAASRADAGQIFRGDPKLEMRW